MIIGISGKKQHGKDTIAKIIQDLTPDMNWEHKKFADTLKDMTCLLLKCTREELEDVEFKTSSVLNGKTTPRDIMQSLGTEWGRKMIHGDIWVNSLFMDYKADFLKPDETGWGDMRFKNWIISDVRFPNEAKAIEKRGGIIIRVERSGITSNDFHASEMALDKYEHFDFIVSNNSSIENLTNNIKYILSELNYYYEKV